MEVFSQVCPFFVSVFETDEWHYPLHRHTHYELIYILHGTGVHYFNEQHFSYQADDLFLCNTRDAHRFAIEQPTRFCIIKLNLAFLLAANDTFALVQPLFEAGEASVPFVFDAATRAYLRSQVEFCIREFAQRQFLYANTIQASVLALLVLLARERRRQQAQPTAATVDNLVPAIIHYLHAHLREPALLAAGTIAAQFHLSPTYIGQYFRRHTGQTLKAFIQKSRIRAIQLQLEFSDKTVSQLAFEYGYTDESHLIKAFRTHLQETPALYRARYTQTDAVHDQGITS
jgi:AraC family L-rhamnose operon regulatory protein RhaS